MSNIVINGTTYNGVESITVKDTSGSDVKYTKGERPSGTIEITENGIHNVADYESANVNVATSGGTDRLQWKCDNIKSLDYEFYNYKGTDFSILDGLDTSQVTTLDSTFYGCGNIESLDLSSFDTGNVTRMFQTFYNCSKLKNLNLGSFNTSKCTYMNALFSGCSSLVSLDLKNFDVSQVTDTGYMFNNCSSLTSLDLSNFYPNKLSYFFGMFYTCRSLTNLDLSTFNTGRLTNFGNLFYGCNKLKEIMGIIDLYSATSLSNMFSGCNAIETFTLKNIKANLQIGASTSWGHLLTSSTLLNTAQELWDNTNNALGGTRKLTLSTPSKTAIQSMYVKLVDVTDEMIAQDQYIANKKPCIECASTDEGAMTLEEYIISKNWSIA